MDKDNFVKLISSKMKLVRTEQDLSQDKMAEILGISKKTLIQIEKGRTKASWTIVVAFCALFNQSELLVSVIGDNPVDFIQLIANRVDGTPKEKTMGGRVWWREVKVKGDFRLQQNVISHHYRILDEDNFRWFSSFEEREALQRLDELE
ncbi:DNA-binding transcriptional regulator, XRE-family HTH domain [Salinibacillus kushneri]|uniref:DNA-binding transcriptional regulator, XRE-family HTH domain n=1 Tax=Salinibacillus kushneri TaxID=237682 RepID=A0A1I0F0E5_9BACI|nr:helix-turn-helix domain-containing protein [Salinibacillus kushneri]SET50855.1 DNA-binding transcriptional regulator, XRE-family HTH domain [Salinibacillus kushneri]